MNQIGDQRGWKPSAATIVLVATALALVGNLATNTVQINSLRGRALAWSGVALLLLVAMIVERAQRRDFSSLPNRPVWHSVPSRLRVYASRESELATLHQLLRRSRQDGVKMVAVHGMGGIGKSTFVAEYSYRHHDEFDLVWWISASNRWSIIARLAELAHELGRPVVQHEQAASAALRILASGKYRWLLVYDDSPEPETLDGLLPSHGPGAVVITSRNPRWTKNAQTLELEILNPVIAESFLRRRLGDDTGSTTALAKRLGYLPLALDAAAEYCETTGTRPEAFLRRIQNPTSELLGTEAELVCRPGFELLAETCPEAIELLAFLSFLAPEDTPRSLPSFAPDSLPHRLAGSVRTDPDLGEVIRELRGVGLVRIDRHSDPSVHDLVQNVMRADVRAGLIGDWDEARWAASVAAALANATTVSEDHTFYRWTWLGRLLRHAQQLLGHCSRLDVRTPAVATLRFNIARYLHDRGERMEPRKLQEAAAADRCLLLGENHIDTARAFSAFSTSLRLKGDLETAEKLSRRAVTIANHTLGTNHPETLRFQSELGNVLFRRGEILAARALREEVVRLALNVLGTEDPQYLLYLNELATVLRAQGHITQALELRWVAHSGLSSVYDDSHPRIQMIRNDLAFTLIDAGDPKTARKLLESTYRTRCQVLGKENPLTLVSMSNLALAIRDQGRLKKAIKMNRYILDTRTKVLGPDDPTTLISMSHLGNALLMRGNREEARQWLEQAFETRQRLLGRSAHATLLVQTKLAKALFELGDLTRARQLYENALDARRTQGGDEDRNVATAKLGLGKIQAVEGDLAGARTMLKAALATRVRILGETHRDTIAAKRDLAGVLDRLGLRSEARSLRRGITENQSIGCRRENPPSGGCGGSERVG